MYRIQGWFPKDGDNCGFSIILTQEWKEAVAVSMITQDDINLFVSTMGNLVMGGHGMRAVGQDIIHMFISVSWGEWGPEHISVPGNACGLDIVHDCPGLSPGEVALVPHNVDTIKQASMILTLFTHIDEVVRRRWDK